MADTAVAGRLDEASRNGSPRRVRRRRSLPGGRAVVGGFLVAAAAVGIFAGYLNATSRSEQDYVVARQDLAVGHRITADDLAGLRAELPPPLGRRAYTDAAALVGAVVLGPVGRGELVQSSDVLAGRGTTRSGQDISFPIASARAVDGQLRPGELIDVLATYGTGADAYTVMVARAVPIADRSQATGTLTGGGEQVITLSIPTSATTMAVAHAVNAGAVTLVRTSPGPETPATTNPQDELPYQTPRPPPPSE